VIDVKKKYFANLRLIELSIALTIPTLADDRSGIKDLIFFRIVCNVGIMYHKNNGLHPAGYLILWPRVS